MDRIDIEAYREDIACAAGMYLPWERLRNKKILISGATGMIGCFLIDVLMEKNLTTGLNCSVIALTRNTDKANRRAVETWKDHVHFVSCDLNMEKPAVKEHIDLVIHAASNTHPVAYATDPIGTITTNIIGTRNMLETAAEHNAERCIFISSVEIYGENRGDCESFDETYCGYIDCNTLRAGYPEGKRAGEALCQAYIQQKGLDIVIPRLPRIYGPTMLQSDTKAISQFLKKGIANEDIVLKSEGNQLFSYSYAADAVLGIFYCLFFGKCGEAYNISDPSSDIKLKDLARMIADYTGTEVIFEIPDQTEKAGYSKATKALLDSTKLKTLGWKPIYPLSAAIPRTIDILRSLKDS